MHLETSLLRSLLCCADVNILIQTWLGCQITSCSASSFSPPPLKHIFEHESHPHPMHNYDITHSSLTPTNPAPVVPCFSICDVTMLIIILFCSSLLGEPPVVTITILSIRVQTLQSTVACPAPAELIPPARRFSLSLRSL